MPDCEKTYVGTQGDIWDAQKDMAMALLGAFLIMGIVSRVHKRKQQPRFPIASL
jgi:putative membrane protein